MARRCITMTCCGKYWNSPIITNIVKRENMITTSGSEKRNEQYEDTLERVYDAEMRLTTEKFLPRLKHRESQRRLELDSLLPEVVLHHDIITSSVGYSRRADKNVVSQRIIETAVCSIKQLQIRSVKH